MWNMLVAKDSGPLNPGFLFFFFFCYNIDELFLKIYFNWRLITLQYCSGFCHTLT